MTEQKLIRTGAATKHRACVRHWRQRHAGQVYRKGQTGHYIWQNPVAFTPNDLRLKERKYNVSDFQI